MALLFMDSFDTSSTAQLGRKWTTLVGSPAITTSNPRNGPQCLQLDRGWRVLKGFANQQSWVVGFGLRVAHVTGTRNPLLGFVDISGFYQCSLCLSSNNILEFCFRGSQNDPGTAVSGGAALQTISLDTWYSIQVKVTIADSIGANTCQVRVNNDLWITVDAGEDLQSTANAYANILVLEGHAAATNVTDLKMDDLYVLDDSGSTNNDFLGDCRVEALLPDGNGTTNQFNGSDGNSVDNYLLVDEVPADDDTTYVEDSTATNQDLYTFDNLSATPVSIFGVQSNIIAKKDDAGARSAKQITRSGVTVYDGDTHALSQGSYGNHACILELDPDTATAWDEAGINAAEFGLETV